jgi:glycosyltransferase involved in cell wall biosynthesis
LGLSTLAQLVRRTGVDRGSKEMKANIGEKISVCLLTYNHVEVIESTVKSILNQTITGYEVIVSDDSSTDGTWESILSLANEDERIIPVRTPYNVGMPGNANFAVAQSIRPYIALLHHDDLYREDLLEKWVGVLERNPDIAFVFNPYGVFQSSYIYEEPMPGERIGGRWLLDNYLFPRWGCVVRGTAMIRRDAWEQVGAMREQFGLLADIDLWMRLSMRWAVGYVPEPVIIVRHQRPSYYPDIYTSKTWSWARQRFLYEIHALNRLDYINLNSMQGRLDWLHFRMRLSVQTAKWLVYAILKRKNDMLASSGDSATLYDLLPLRAFRRVLQITLSANDV